MRCDDLRGLLAGLAAGDLSPAQEEFVHLHLQGCARCQTAYAGLLQTRRQMESLRDDSYHPRLTGRITREIGRHRTRRAILSWTGRGLRGAGVLAVVTLVIGLLLWQRGPLQQAAAPPPPQPVYLVAGTDLLYLEAPGREPRRVATLPPGAQLLPGGLLRFDSVLDRIHLPRSSEVPGPSAARVTDALPAEVRHIAGSDRSAWLIRQVDSAFAVDRLDLATGAVAPDPAPKEGEVFRALLSPDGSELYLLARAGGFPYVKVIDPQTGGLRTAHRLTAGFGPQALLLLSGEGALLHVIDEGRLMVIDQRRSAIALDRQVGGLTAVAAISPDGSQILSARPDGGLSLVDARTGEIIRQSDRHRYSQVLWHGDWAYGLREGALDLVDPSGLQVKRSSPVPTGTTHLQLP